MAISARARPGNPPPAVAPNLADLVALAGPARSLRLRPPFRVVAEQSGPHQSRFRGRGLEFSELREYQVGDDLRDIDWRSTARTGTPHIRCYRAERERTLWLVVDQRVGMRFGTRGCFKSVAAARAGALLGWAGMQSGDRVGGVVLTDDGCREFRPRRSRDTLLRLLGALCQAGAAPVDAVPDAPPSLRQAFEHSTALLRPGALVFVASDFHDLADADLPALRQLQRRNDVIALCVTDPLEHRLPPPAWYTFASGGTRHRVHTGDDAVREHFASRIAAREDFLARAFADLRLPRLDLQTGGNLLAALQRGLGSHAR